MIREHLTDGGVLVDVGCGSGGHEVFNYRATAMRSIGLDVDPSVADNELAHHRAAGDGGQMPVRSSVADVVVSQEVLEHLRDPGAFFREASRVLKPGGVLLLMTPNLWSPVSVLSRVTPLWFHKWAYTRLVNSPDTKVFATYYRANSPRRLRRLGAEGGLEQVEMRLFEGTPGYGVFSTILTYAELSWAAALRRFDWLAGFRGVIMAVFRRIATGGSSAEAPQSSQGKRGSTPAEHGGGSRRRLGIPGHRPDPRSPEEVTASKGRGPAARAARSVRE